MSSRQPRRFGRAALVGGAGVLVAGAMKLVRIVSLAALVFASASPELLRDGLALAVIGTSVATLWIALRTSLPGVQAGVQGVPVAILAVAVGQAMAAAPEGAVHGTALAVVVASGVLTGLVMLGLGVTGAARLVRYLPHPVSAGVLAASGWLLLESAVRMMAGPTGERLFAPEAVLHWGPGVALGIWMFALARVVRRPLVVPGTLVAGFGLFYLVAWFNGLGPARLAEEGWLFGPFPSGSLWRLPPVDALWTADRAAVLGQLPALATVALLTALLVVTYTSALEFERDRDADAGRELREAGVANLLGAAFAGFTTTVTPSGTRLAASMRVRRRVDAAVAPLVAIPILAFGAGLLEAIPLMVLGAVLVYLGFDYLNEWLLSGWRRLSLLDLVVVATIVATVAVFGLIPGVGVGLAVTVVMFVVATARTDVIAEARTGRELRSRVTRSAAARELLFDQGGRTLVYHLEGTVFFGTADRLVRVVKDRLAEEPQPRYVVLDVGSASTFDATGGVAVLRIARAAAQVGAETIVVGAGPIVRRVMTRSGAEVAFEPDLDRALETCEKGLLREHGVHQDRPTFEDALADLPGGPATWAELRSWFEPVDVEAGTTVLSQGDAADDFWILAEGRVSAVLRRDDASTMRLESLVPGQVIGELGFVTGAPRSADIVADESARLYRMTRSSWRELSASRPDLAIALRDMLLQLAAERVTHLTTALAAARA
jgi:SulP family sulfate permease